MSLAFVYIILIVILICVILIIYSSIYNKFEECIIRINEAEGNIDNSLRKKYDLINRTIAIIKGNVKIDREIFEDIIKLRSRKISNFDLDRELEHAYNEFLGLQEEFKELGKSDELKKISKNIKNIDSKLIVLKSYYDECITRYNKLTRMFPTNIVASICKYKERPFFDRKNMNDEIFDDFKL
ncbi:MAG: LemA family protein [bacterium]|nr:LemA family protein [bacterium]